MYVFIPSFTFLGGYYWRMLNHYVLVYQGTYTIKFGLYDRPSECVLVFYTSPSSSFSLSVHDWLEFSMSEVLYCRGDINPCVCSLTHLLYDLTLFNGLREWNTFPYFLEFSRHFSSLSCCWIREPVRSLLRVVRDFYMTVLDFSLYDTHVFSV